MSNDILWKGRSWIRQKEEINENKKSTTFFSIVSYLVLSDYKAQNLYFSSSKNWDLRSSTLLNEIIYYNPDIICVQDADHFKDFWRPQLMINGYDSVFKQRTQLRDFHDEGVFISYKREKFQLFKTVFIEFNDAVDDDTRGNEFLNKSKTDDVGLLLYLSPYQKGDLNSSLCVGSIFLNENPEFQDVRLAHCEYLAKVIENTNKEFQAPIVLGMSLNDPPSSPSYALMKTGRLPLAGQVPPKCSKPYGLPTCRGSVLLKWTPPKISIADPPIHSFRITWRPGGSNVLGFRSELIVKNEDCVKYSLVIDQFGNKRMEANKEREFVISGLSSELPFEFRILAINQIGEGVWSHISEPVVMKNPEKAPLMPNLENFLDLHQLIEQKETLSMNLNDWDVKKAYIPNPVDAETNLTPRDRKGVPLNDIPKARVLPSNSNPRSGWRGFLNGQRDDNVYNELNLNSNIKKSILRDHKGFLKRELNQFIDPLQDDLAVVKGIGELKLDPPQVEINKNIQFEAEPLESIASKENDDNAFSQAYNSVSEISELGEIESLASIQEDGPIDSRLSKNAPPSSTLSRGIDIENNVVLDCREVLHKIGVRNARQVHSLVLSSAYENYSCGGEPLFTTSFPSNKSKIGLECSDYIFYSTNELKVKSLLSLPRLSDQSDGLNPQEPYSLVDENHLEPFPICKSSFNDKVNKFFDKNKAHEGNISHSSSVHQLKLQLEKSRKFMNTAPTKSFKPKHSKEEFWGGRWATLPKQNKSKSNLYLPNQSYSSTHFCIGVQLEFDKDFLSSILD